MRKSAQIQLRVAPAQKADLMRRARAAGLGLSEWMLGRLIPDRRVRFLALTRSLATTSRPSYVLAAIHDLLAGLHRADLADVTEGFVDSTRSGVVSNQLAAMVETAAARLGTPPPRWVDDIRPLRTPWFASDLISLRLHLLCNSPPAFRRRNLFVDASVGARV